MTRRRHGILKGQATIVVALSMVAFCGMLALAVDVGVTTTRDRTLRHAANTAAYSGAYLLYGQHVGATTPYTLTDTEVLNTITTTLSQANLSVVKVITTTGTVPDPCAAGYRSNQVSVSATYLAPDDEPITTTGTSPWLVGSQTSNGYDTSGIPGLAAGIQVTLGACQSAAFGGVLGHPLFTIRVTGLAGGRLPGTPIPAADCTTSPGGSCYSISSAPRDELTPVPGSNGICPSGVNNNTGWSHEFYCKGIYKIGDPVTIFADGAGLQNYYGDFSGFKGRIGSAIHWGVENGYKVGGGNGGSCPTTPVVVPIISYVKHAGRSAYFVPLEWVVVQVDQTSCGSNQIHGTIVDAYDPWCYGVVVGAQLGPSCAALPTATPGTPAATTTSTAPTATPIVPALRSTPQPGYTTSTTNSLTIPKPAGVMADDVLVAQVTFWGSNKILAPSPSQSGWMSLSSSPQLVKGNALTQVIYYHVAGNTEPASYTWTWSGSVQAAGSIAAYYNVDTNNPLNGYSGGGGNAATITAPSIPTNVNSNSALIGFFSIVGGTTISPPEANTWTAQSADTSKGAINVTIAAGDEVQTTAGMTGNRIAIVPISAANTNYGQLMALQPAPTPTANGAATPAATPTTAVAATTPWATPPPTPTMVLPVIPVP